MTTPTRPTAGSRVEGLVLAAILLTVAGFAGAASFTHVHDWTMTNSPAGTPGWFGWANAVISELVPIAALLTIRQRRRTGAPIGYPMFLLIASASLSLAAQLAVAKPGPSGWLLSAVPAIAFMALVKLVLAPVKTTDAAHDTADTVPAIAETARPSTPTVEPATAVEPLPVPAHLIPTARFSIVNHEQVNGRPITADELADRMNLAPAVAAQLLAELQPPAPVPARINGNPVHVGGAG